MKSGEFILLLSALYDLSPNASASPGNQSITGVDRRTPTLEIQQRVDAFRRTRRLFL